MLPGFFFNCKICHTKFLSYKILKQHKCGPGPKEDVIKQEFVDPLQKILTKPIKQFVCDICQTILPTEITFEVHMKIHSLEVKANCQYINCNKVFNKSSLLWDHKLNKHEMTKEAWKEVNSSCIHCKKVCRDKSQLKMHLKKHSNKKDFQCTTCPKQFKSPRALDNHEKHHKGIFDHACVSCEKRYVSGTLLKKHQDEKHSEIKLDFSCGQCGNVFPSKHQLGLHTSIHTGEKPLQCREDGCDRKFRAYSTRGNHEKTHTGVKKFKCKECFKMFLKRCTLRIHEKRHEGRKDHMCNVCGKTFVEPAGARNCKHRLELHRQFSSV